MKKMLKCWFAAQSLIVIKILLGFSLNGAEFSEFTEFSEFRESTEAWIRLNLTVFFASCVCGTMVESLSLTREIVGSSPAIFLK